ncbi:MAG: hypothetical protein E7B11_00690 [Clostridiales bacterium]|nr:hypothetical protein [Clostridiales bacterium]MDU3239067.1 hypothetical protein [Clostridiales bacterium]
MKESTGKVSEFYAKTIPIIAMTANTFAKDVDMALQSGMNYHLAKPPDIPQLMNNFNKWL